MLVIRMYYGADAFMGTVRMPMLCKRRLLFLEAVQMGKAHYVCFIGRSEWGWPGWQCVPRVTVRYVPRVSEGVVPTAWLRIDRRRLQWWKVSLHWQGRWGRWRERWWLLFLATRILEMKLVATRYVYRELKELELLEMESFRERMSPRDDMRVIESERERLSSGVKQSKQ